MLRRLLRYLFLVPPLLVTLIWTWSYLERVDIPCYDTLHYPQQPRGGETFATTHISKGEINLRYCRVLPGAPLGYSDIPRRLGFGYTMVADNRYQAGTFIDREFYAPVWSVLLLALIYPCIKAIRYIRRSLRPKPGHCHHCGYNLTGNVSGVCPECGTTSAPEPATDAYCAPAPATRAIASRSRPTSTGFVR
jgi:hypothetical protein